MLGWRSGKLHRIASSTFEAEVLALADGLEEAVVLKRQLQQMTGMGNDLIKVEAFCDCADAVEAVHSSKQINSSRRDRTCLDVEKVKEMMEQGHVDTVSWVGTNQQLADPLTKMGASKEMLGLVLQNGQFYAHPYNS